MKALLDTSVLVPALVSGHPHHTRALPWVQRCKAGELEGVLATHSLAELYAVLTRLPVQPRIGPGAAWRLIRENFLADFALIALSPRDYRQALQTLAELQVEGGAVYDALIAYAARKAGVDRLVTFNADDFRRVWPEGAAKVVVP